VLVEVDPLSGGFLQGIQRLVVAEGLVSRLPRERPEDAQYLRVVSDLAEGRQTALQALLDRGEWAVGGSLTGHDPRVEVARLEAHLEARLVDVEVLTSGGLHRLEGLQWDEVVVPGHPRDRVERLANRIVRVRLEALALLDARKDELQVVAHQGAELGVVLRGGRSRRRGRREKRAKAKERADEDDPGARFTGDHFDHCRPPAAVRHRFGDDRVLPARARDRLPSSWRPIYRLLGFIASGRSPYRGA
jgi:hypothetical protein